jgi:hypothetical protein
VEESSIKKAKGLADAIKSIAGIAISLGLIISTGSYAYSKIFETERNLKLETETRKKEITLAEERGAKRYERMLDYIKALEKLRKENEDRIVELEKEYSEIKGYIKGVKEKR